MYSIFMFGWLSSKCQQQQNWKNSMELQMCNFQVVFGVFVFGRNVSRAWSRCTEVWFSYYSTVSFWLYWFARQINWSLFSFAQCQYNYEPLRHETQLQQPLTAAEYIYIYIPCKICRQSKYVEWMQLYEVIKCWILFIVDLKSSPRYVGIQQSGII